MHIDSTSKEELTLRMHENLRLTKLNFNFLTGISPFLALCLAE